MTERGGSRIVASLLTAAEALERAETGPDVRAAVRDGLLGMEYHLDTLAKELARGPAEPGAFDPPVRTRAERVEARLRGLLVTAWSMLTKPDAELGTLHAARDLAKDLRSVEHADFELVFDQLLAPSALD